MAIVIKRGKKWYARYQDESGKQKWKSGFTDKAKTLHMANRLEDECRRVKLGDIDPQADARRLERAKAVQVHLDAFKSHMQAKARHHKHIAYTVKDIERFLGHSKVANASAITLPMV